MQINCSHCHRPYAISKDEVHAALDQLDAEHQGHYNTSCPHCRRVNRVSFSQMQHAAPDWTSHTQEEKVNE